MPIRKVSGAQVRLQMDGPMLPEGGAEFSVASVFSRLEQSGKGGTPPRQMRKQLQTVSFGGFIPGMEN